MKGLTPKTKNNKIFISAKKDSNGSFMLFYKKKFHCDASTITEYHKVVMIKQYNKNVIYIFDSYYQTLVKEIIWDKDRIPKYKEE